MVVVSRFTVDHRVPIWAVDVMWASTGLVYVGSVIFYLYVRLVQRRGISEYIEEHPSITKIQNSIARITDRFLSIIGTAINKALSGVWVLLVIAVVLAILAVVIYFGVSILESLIGPITAPWWAIVIIILLVLLLFK